MGLKPNTNELHKLKGRAVSCTTASTLLVTKADALQTSINYLLSVLAITTCEAECCTSSLRRLKAYMRSMMGQERFTGLANLSAHLVDVNDTVTQLIVSIHKLEIFLRTKIVL